MESRLKTILFVIILIGSLTISGIMLYFKYTEHQAINQRVHAVDAVERPRSQPIERLPSTDAAPTTQFEPVDLPDIDQVTSLVHALKDLTEVATPLLFPIVTFYIGRKQPQAQIAE